MTVVITGAAGTLGAALCAHYAARGDLVIGVSRRAGVEVAGCERVLANGQESLGDAHALLDEAPTRIVLNAGQIEREVGPGGTPLIDQCEDILRINTLFPMRCMTAALARPPKGPLDLVVVGSIADGAPSPFGPIYHASKVATHYLFSGVAPIAADAAPGLRLRVYRPGAIRGPLAWAPTLRLDERGTRIRARRCERAPAAETVAAHFARWADGDDPVGTYDEPVSFRLLKLLFAVSPGLHQRVQRFGWSRVNRYRG